MDINNSWDGKFSNLKISEHAFPELFRELQSLHHKERSDRLRLLAVIGLYSLNSMGQNAVNTLTQIGQSEELMSRNQSEQTPKVKESRILLKKRLLGSI